MNLSPVNWQLVKFELEVNFELVVKQQQARNLRVLQQLFHNDVPVLHELDSYQLKYL